MQAAASWGSFGFAIASPVSYAFSVPRPPAPHAHRNAIALRVIVKLHRW